MKRTGENGGGGGEGKGVLMHQGTGSRDEVIREKAGNNNLVGGLRVMTRPIFLRRAVGVSVWQCSVKPSAVQQTGA